MYLQNYIRRLSAKLNASILYLNTGRNFEYPEALRLIQNEDYLDDADIDELRRNDIVRKIDEFDEKVNFRQKRQGPNSPNRLPNNRGNNRRRCGNNNNDNNDEVGHFDALANTGNTKACRRNGNRNRNNNNNNGVSQNQLDQSLEFMSEECLPLKIQTDIPRANGPF